ncbi:MAG: alkaline phosphatase [Bacteroidota bacterium]
MKNLGLFTALLLGFFSLSAQTSPKNIILFIGDGMGISQISSGVYSQTGPSNFERIRHIGLIKTHSLRDLITDSAAGATAFATGSKTYNGAIAMDENGKPLKTILEIAHDYELGTGVIATSTIQHATPACFYAHRPERTMYEDITLDFLRGTVDIAIGGGMRLFKKRKDKQDVSVKMEEMGYTFYQKLDEALRDPKERMMVITHKGHLPSIKGGRGSYLQTASLLAIDQLRKQPKGFFLMIEASQIDWGGHSNNGEYIINEVIDLDHTLGALLDFVEQDGETLLIVTADHETGGFSIIGEEENGKLKTGFTTGDHTAALIPVFAYGPGAENFMGVYDNTEVFHKMLQAYNFDNNLSNTPNR